LLNGGLITLRQWVADVENGKSTAKGLGNLHEFKELKERLQEHVSTGNHPKTLKLHEILSDHFKRHEQGSSVTKSIVFVSLRATVDVLVSSLRTNPLIKPSGFVGQGKSSSAAAAQKAAAAQASASGGSSGASATAARAVGGGLSANGSPQGGGSTGGHNQQMQAAILNKFKAGGFNVLVATSIAEEGLDIGDVDLVIHYDVVADPTRFVQRTGRAGRKR
jgi:ERCC4-related helicase